MIGEYTLKILCDKYNISSDKIVNKNNNILTYGEYIDIDKTLDYLINKLNISASNIEKCPSILYRNVIEIEKNVSFLKQQKIYFSSIENCLHVLSTNSEDLVETYKYIEENYGVSALNKNTSALSCNKELIIEVERLNLNKDWNLAIAQSLGFGHTTIENVKAMINSAEYKKYPELFTSEVLANAKIEDISELLRIPYWSDERYKKLLTSSIVARSKQMLKKLPILFEMAEEYQIENYINTSFLSLSPSQNYALINYLIDNNLPLVIDNKLNTIFSKCPSVLKKKIWNRYKRIDEKISI